MIAFKLCSVTAALLRWDRLVIALCSISDPCMSLSPPCFTDEDRFSLEALQTIHKQMDDDKDGGIEVDESDEVSGDTFSGDLTEQNDLCFYT